MYFDDAIKRANNLSDEIAYVLKDQKIKYDILSQKHFLNNLWNYISKDGKILIPSDALLHGTTFDKDNLLNIKKEGILASEFFNGRPDMFCETYFMADFFKNITKKDTPIADLLNCFDRSRLAEYLPNGNYHQNKFRVAFIVNTDNKDIKSYLKRDLFSNDNSELLEFVDEDFIYQIESRKHLIYYANKLGQSSIPIGIPYSALSGIIVDGMLEELNDGDMKFLKQTFGKELFIISSNGKVLSSPKQKTDSLEM